MNGPRFVSDLLATSLVKSMMRTAYLPYSLEMRERDGHSLAPLCNSFRVALQPSRDRQQVTPANRLLA